MKMAYNILLIAAIADGSLFARNRPEIPSGFLSDLFLLLFHSFIITVSLTFHNIFTSRAISLFVRVSHRHTLFRKLFHAINL